MRIGIRTKALAIPAVILLMAIAGNTFLLSARFREEHARSVHNGVQLIGHKLKLQMERLLQLGIALGDIEGYDEQCREVLDDYPDLSYTLISDLRGRVLFEAGLADREVVFDVGHVPAQRDEAFITHDVSGDEYYNAAVPILDADGEQQAWAIVGFSRDLLDARISRLRSSSIAAGVASIALAIVLLWAALSALVTRPILTLLAATRQIRSSGDLTRRVVVRSHDEVGTLATSFNELLQSIVDRDEQIQRHLRALQEAREQLEHRVEERTAELTAANAELQQEIARRCEAERRREQLHAELVETSRKAGMADVATGVLHNVGNVLNSVNVSADVACRQLRESRLPALQKAVDLIEQYRDDLGAFCTSDERGRHLPAFLAQLSRCLAEEHERSLQELQSLAENINHIKEIVSMQQTLARVSGASEELEIAAVVEDALKINHAGLLRHGVTVERSLGQGLKITTDRHKLLQILINLISNAKYALSASPNEPRRLAIRSERSGDEVVITVADNGAGIREDHMPLLFTFGFTTKQQGHGFGLHSSALAAREIGGVLTAHSDGPGAGAVFEVRLPIAFNGERTCPSNQTTVTSAGSL